MLALYVKALVIHVELFLYYILKILCISLSAADCHYWEGFPQSFCSRNWIDNEEHTAHWKSQCYWRCDSLPWETVCQPILCAFRLSDVGHSQVQICTQQDIISTDPCSGENFNLILVIEVLGLTNFISTAET